jgi:spermidine synthase
MLHKRTSFLLLYFFCAATALSLEVVWTRLLATVLGSSAEAVAGVLAAFMGGFGFGAFVASKRVPALLHPRRAFLLFQLISAGLGWLPYATLALPAETRTCFGICFVFLSSFPFGWMYPLAIRFLENEPSGRGSTSGRLYAVDTLGALVGCLTTGFAFVPAFGIRITLWLATAIRLLMAFCAVFYTDQKSPERIPVLRRDEKIPSTLLVLVFAQGFALLGAENLWSRMLAFVLYRGSTTYAITAMLASVLAFTSLGAFVFSRKEPSRSYPHRIAQASTLCAASLLFSLVVMLLVGPAPSTVPLSLSDLLTTLFCTGPASFASGAVFSLACQWSARQHPSLGPSRLLALNALGAMAGSLLTPLFLVPRIGLGPSLLSLGVLLTLTGAVFAFQNRLPVGLKLLFPSALLFLSLPLCLAGPVWNRHLGSVLYYHEGKDVSVAVVQVKSGSKRLNIDGIAVAGTDLAMQTDQKMLAHLPVLLHPDPKRVLSIGLGSGQTSRTFLLYPKLQVDCMEISPSLLKASKFLTEVNDHLLERAEPRFSLSLGDARFLLAKSDKRWDVIVSDCTDLAFRSDSLLYTREFFQAIRSHLQPGGIGAAWIPLRGEPPYAVMRSVLGAFVSAFNNTSLWVFDAYPIHFGILLGSEKELPFDLFRVREALSNSAIFLDLQAIGLEDPFRLAGSRQFDDASLRSFAAGAPVHSNDHPVVEFIAPFESGDDASAYQMMWDLGPSSAPTSVTRASSEDLRILARKLIERPWLFSGHHAWVSGEEDRARQFYLRALNLDPSDAAPRHLLGVPPKKVGEWEQVLMHQKADLSTLLNLAVLALYESRPANALSLANLALLKSPLDPRASVLAGMAALRLDNLQPAKEFFRRALKEPMTDEMAQRVLLGEWLTELPWVLRKLVLGLTFPGL